MSRSEKFFDRVANRREVTKGGQTFKRTISGVKKHLCVDDVVLDFACGTGSLTCELAEEVSGIHGIDTSGNMIAVARAAAVERNAANLRFSHTDIFDATLAQESFDVVLAFNVLHYLDDASTTLQRVHRLLKPNGLFISSTACLGERTTPLGLFVRLLGKTRVVPPMTFFRAPELEASISHEGFQIVEATTISPALSERLLVARRT
jgi:2-polyprenyl-3-methyl-5-hydroxy-6-metoxy-1,4-benzoquinol methylase